MENYFSVIIPTMWKSSKINEALKIYEKSEYVKEIILIDNNPNSKIDLTPFKKVKYFTEERNLYVNVSWNIGFSLSRYKIILANDDIVIYDIDKVLINILRSDYDIVGIDLKSDNNRELFISDIRDFPENGYGSFMYIKNYIYIPEQIKIWYGDTILFDKSQKRGIIKNAKIDSSVSSTVNFIKRNGGEQILIEDKNHYELISQKKDRFNIIIRTSGRPKFFEKCFNSVLKHFPESKLHITIDDINDLKYVQEIVKGIDYNFYLVNKKTVSTICNNIQITREKFIYNYYFNIVKPFLHGWCLFLDDDDMLIDKPSFNYNDVNKVNVFKVDLNWKIVPSDVNFGKRPVLNDINTSCVVVHSSKLINWIPNRGGDFDFINGLFRQYYFNWINKILVKSQEGGNFGRRNDLKITNNFNLKGFYLNLDKRPDRKNKMENQIVKLPYEISRFPAIDGDRISSPENFKSTIKNSESKQYATYLSHYEMIKYARDNNWNHLLILEDDVTLCDDFQKRLEFFMDIVPDDWSIVYLGFNEQPDTKLFKINEFVYKVENVLGCFGMIINENYYDELIEIIENNLMPIDNLISTFVQIKQSCYSFIPFFLYVNDDYSDIWNTHRVLDRIKKYYKSTLPLKLNFDFTIQIENSNGVSQLSDENFTFKEKSLEKLKRIMNLDDSKKNEINYDVINSVINKKIGVYNTSNSIKPIRQNIPQNRNEIIQLKKDSLSKTSKDLFSKSKKFKG
jgi:GR25 family glycosyltransferase involved in LPS biosynthesis